MSSRNGNILKVTGENAYEFHQRYFLNEKPGEIPAELFYKEDTTESEKEEMKEALRDGLKVWLGRFDCIVKPENPDTDTKEITYSFNTMQTPPICFSSAISAVILDTTFELTYTNSEHGWQGVLTALNGEFTHKDKTVKPY